MKLKALILSSFLVLAACSNDDLIEKNYISSCASQGASEEVCSCVFTDLKDSIGVDEIVKANKFLIKGETPSVAFTEGTIKAIVKCIKSQN